MKRLLWSLLAVISLFSVQAEGAVKLFGMKGRANAASGLAAPTYVRQTSASNSTGTTTASSFLVDGTNKVLVVLIGRYSVTTINSLTWNTSENFTQVPSALINFYDASGKFDAYYLINPTSTTANIVATGSSAGNIQFCALLFNGANQTTPIGTVAVLYNSNASPTSTSSVAPASATNSLMCDSTFTYPTDDWAGTSGQTLRSNISFASNNLRVSTLAGSAGTTTLAWSGTSEANSHIAFAVNP